MFHSTIKTEIKIFTMTSKRVFKHPLIDSTTEIAKEEINSDYNYSKAESVITFVSVILLIACLFCGWFFLGVDDDSFPIVAFAVVPIGILYVVGALTSVGLLWYSFEEQLKTKTVTLINVIIYLGILIIGLV